MVMLHFYGSRLDKMMMVIVSYDVSTKDAAGSKHLRHVAKICEDYGQRIQNSVFKCLVDAKTLEILKERLLSEMNKSTDSLYFFNLGTKHNNKVKCYGAIIPLRVTLEIIKVSFLRGFSYAQLFDNGQAQAAQRLSGF